MIKSAFAALAAAPLFAGAAMAGPYVNVEANSGFTGSNYTGTSIDNHVGYKVLWVLTLLGISKQVLLSFFLTVVLLTGFLQVRQVLALV